MVSYWLAVLKPKTRDDKVWWMPDIVEHVVCLLDDHAEDGVVMGAIYSERDKPKENDANLFKVEFSDGGSFAYHRRTGAMELIAKGTFSVTADKSASITAPTITLKGKTTIEGDTAVNGSTINLNAPKVTAAGSPVSRIGDKDNKGDVMVTGAG